MKSLGKPKYREVIYDSFDLNERGELVLGDDIVDEGEDVSWV